ncbi:MAG: hypothetical protein MI922_30035, partial [Bacteroidales bacterium]|nr:hypothetical protein [Bacteroidales bacterium]
MRGKFENIIVLSLFLLLSTLVEGQRHYKVQAVDELNTAFSSEIGFTITSEGFVFASNRKSNVFTTHKDQYNRSFYSLYEVNRKGDNLTSPKIMARDLIGNDHMSMPTISEDGNTMYFTRAYSVSTNTEGETQYINGIFVCEKRNNE